ncbi:MAG: hypothetical protein LBI81_03125 [Puniceicoccales bacterium]|jgi:hypothetical protein|nr:hypothetical protein [Puniceicoccales bacterium]
MKKLSIMFAALLGVACLGAADASASWQSDISVDASAKFESKHVFRGRQQMKEAFVTDLCIGYKGFSDIELYLGADAAFGLHSYRKVPDLAGGVLAIADMEAASNMGFLRHLNENLSPYIGIVYEIDDTFSIEGGYTHHFYVSRSFITTLAEVTEKGSDEIYAGVCADILLSPSAYCFYDFSRREFALEGKVGYYFDLSEQVLSGLGIDLGAKLGYDRTVKPYGAKEQIETIFPSESKKGYWYYGITADLVCALGEHAKTKIGAAVEGNSAKGDSWVNNGGIDGSKRTSVWFNASVDCSF